MDPRRRIPATDALLEGTEMKALVSRFGRTRTAAVLRRVLEDLRREEVSALDQLPLEDASWYAQAVEAQLEEDDRPSLRRVINATGVVLHTNLGRAPLAESALAAMERVGRGYTNLEFDLEEGRRGSRYDHCVSLLTELTGAEDALVVNNCAAALMLALNTVALGRDVVVSRGELVEIGGGFRVPEILERSGARLVEVGSTNRTRASDYVEACVEGETAAFLKVHRSNFRITGFAEEADVDELAGAAAEAGIPLLYDLGSGLLADPELLGLGPEPRAPEALARGTDVVAISGDKLLGGPQAGILLGRGAWIGAMRKNPMCRALRVDKTTLAALEATLRLYRDPERAVAAIPVLRMLAAPLDALEARAHALAAALSARGVGAAAARGEGAVGGGTYPGVALPSWTVRIPASGGAGTSTAAALRRRDPPVVVRLEGEHLVVDLRTVLPEEDDEVARALAAAVARIPAE
ncbi:MAG: L-seryl-tRNA(Sec) selenium transferase [Gemmatimonadota bacterium]